MKTEKTSNKTCLPAVKECYCNKKKNNKKIKWKFPDYFSPGEFVSHCYQTIKNAKTHTHKKKQTKTKNRSFFAAAVERVFVKIYWNVALIEHSTPINGI